MIKLCEFDKRLVSRALEIVDKYGNIEDCEWEDAADDFEEDIANDKYEGVNEEQIMEKMLGGKIVNEEA